MTVTSGGLLTLPSYALLGFARENHLSPLFREFLRSRTQRASGAERLRCFEPRLLLAEPAHQLGAHARLATSNAGEQSHLVVLIECGDPSIDFLGTRYGRCLRGAFHRSAHQVLVKTYDVDEAFKRR